MDYVINLTPLLLLLLAFVWAYQFVFLMLMKDDLFPGRSDKLIWGIAFCIMFPVTPFAFIYWRRTALRLKVTDVSARSGS
jgi:hypothetical protein